MHVSTFQAWTAVLLTLLTPAARAKVEVVLSPECRDFFYMGTPPPGLKHPSLRFICQRYQKRARYVTLYNTDDRIPVYSAYTFKRSAGERCADVPWMYEPQLATPSDSDEMQPFPADQTTHMNFGDNQAVLDDYTNAVLYERVALNPDEHQASTGDKAATYTLTNVVPAVPDFHTRAWGRQEGAVRRRLNNYCRGTAHVVTGITTSGKMVRRHNIDRMAVPTYLWSAYCCPDFDRNAPFAERYKFPSYAHYGLNEEAGEVVEMSVQKLKEFLQKTTFVDQNFQIFVEDCVQKTPGKTLE